VVREAAGHPAAVAAVAVAVASRPTNPVLRVLDSVPAKWWLFGIAALVLAASALFGGLADAGRAEVELPVLTAGEEFVGPQLTTTISSAELTDVAPDYSFEPEEGNTYLVVTAVVTNTVKKSTTSVADLLQLEWLDDDAQGVTERVALVSDGTSLPQANPGVPIEVAFVWEVPVGNVVPGDTFGDYWSNPVVAAHVDVEVR
jgi:hypothetical protein